MDGLSSYLEDDILENVRANSVEGSMMGIKVIIKSSPRDSKMWSKSQEEGLGIKGCCIRNNPVAGVPF